MCGRHDMLNLLSYLFLIWKNESRTMYLGSLLDLVYVILKMESITCPFLRRERPFSMDHDN